jgi:hypothetical protein
MGRLASSRRGDRVRGRSVRLPDELDNQRHGTAGGGPEVGPNPPTDWERDLEFADQTDPGIISRIGWLVAFVLAVAISAAFGGLVAHALLWWATH